MHATGRTPILSPDERKFEASGRQKSDDMKYDSRRSFMIVVAKATDVLVKRAPVSQSGELPHTRWEYHERMPSGRLLEDE